MDTFASKEGSHRGLILRLLFTIGLLAVVVWLVDFRELGGVFVSLHWAWLAAAVGLAFADRILATLRWWYLLRAKGVAMGFVPLLILHLHAGFLGGFLPTTFSVDAVRIVMLSARTGKTVECIATSVVDRFMMMLGTMALAVPMVFVLAGTGFGGQLDLSPAALWVLAAALTAAPLALLGGLVVFLIAGRSGATRVRGMMGTLLSHTVGERLTEKAGMLYWAMHEFHRHRAVMVFGSVITVIMLGVRLMCILVLAWAVRAEPIVVGVLVAAPVIWVVLMLPISIGGFGFQEVTYAALLGSAGITSTVAVSMSLIEHVLVRAASLPGTLLWTFGADSTTRPKHPQASASADRTDPPRPTVSSRVAVPGRCSE